MMGRNYKTLLQLFAIRTLNLAMAVLWVGVFGGLLAKILELLAAHFQPHIQ